MPADTCCIVPMYNEGQVISQVVTDLKSVFPSVLCVDDGSTDDSWNVIEQLRAVNPHIKGIKFQRNYGKSAALNEGFKASQADVVITMDADMQDSPDEIPGLYKMIM